MILVKMVHKRFVISLSCMLVPVIPLMAAAGRASDGLFFFIVVLAFLGSILGILYLVDLVRDLIRRYFEKNGQESLHGPD